MTFPYAVSHIWRRSANQNPQSRFMAPDAGIRRLSTRRWLLFLAPVASVADFPKKDRAVGRLRSIAEHSQENRLTEGPDLPAKSDLFPVTRGYPCQFYRDS
jgi:hypothetical protein